MSYVLGRSQGLLLQQLMLPTIPQFLCLLPTSLTPAASIVSLPALAPSPPQDIIKKFAFYSCPLPLLSPAPTPYPLHPAPTPCLYPLPPTSTTCTYPLSLPPSSYSCPCLYPLPLPPPVSPLGALLPEPPLPGLPRHCHPLAPSTCTQRGVIFIYMLVFW